MLVGGNKGPACLDSRHRIHNKSIVPHARTHARTHAPDYSCSLAAASRRCWPSRPTYLTLPIDSLDEPAPTSLTLPPPPPPLHPPTFPPLHTHTHTHTINTYRRRAFHRAELGPYPRRAPIASEHSTGYRQSSVQGAGRARGEGKRPTQVTLHATQKDNNASRGGVASI